MRLVLAICLVAGVMLVGCKGDDNAAAEGQKPAQMNSAPGAASGGGVAPPPADTPVKAPGN